MRSVQCTWSTPVLRVIWIKFIAFECFHLKVTYRWFTLRSSYMLPYHECPIGGSLPTLKCEVWSWSRLINDRAWWENLKWFVYRIEWKMWLTMGHTMSLVSNPVDMDECEDLYDIIHLWGAYSQPRGLTVSFVDLQRRTAGSVNDLVLLGHYPWSGKMKWLQLQSVHHQPL